MNNIYDKCYKVVLVYLQITHEEYEWDIAKDSLITYEEYYNK